MSRQPDKPTSTRISAIKARDLLAEAGEYAASINSEYTEDDVTRLIKESRAEAKTIQKINIPES